MDYYLDQAAFERRWKREQAINDRLYPSRIKIVESDAVPFGELFMVDFQSVCDRMYEGKTLAEAVQKHAFKIKQADDKGAR